MSIEAWKRRVTHSANVSPDLLMNNPDNVKIHPESQVDAMRELLKQVGYVGDVLVSQRSNVVLDGHMRIMIAIRDGEPTIPVSYVDLSATEEQQAMVYLFQTTRMARLDPLILERAIDSVGITDDQVGAFLGSLAAQHGIEYTDAYAAAMASIGEQPTEDGGVLTTHDRHYFGAVDEDQPFVIGDIAFLIDADTFEAWAGRMRAEFTTRPRTIMFEVVRRLGLQ